MYERPRTHIVTAVSLALAALVGIPPSRVMADTGGSCDVGKLGKDLQDAQHRLDVIRAAASDTPVNLKALGKPAHWSEFTKTLGQYPKDDPRCVFFVDSLLPGIIESLESLVGSEGSKVAIEDPEARLFMESMRTQALAEVRERSIAFEKAWAVLIGAGDGFSRSFFQRRTTYKHVNEEDGFLPESIAVFHSDFQNAISRFCDLATGEQCHADNLVFLKPWQHLLAQVPNNAVFFRENSSDVVRDAETRLTLQVEKLLAQSSRDANDKQLTVLLIARTSEVGHDGLEREKKLANDRAEAVRGILAKAVGPAALATENPKVRFRIVPVIWAKRASFPPYANRATLDLLDQLLDPKIGSPELDSQLIKTARSCLPKTEPKGTPAQRRDSIQRYASCWPAVSRLLDRTVEAYFIWLPRSRAGPNADTTKPQPLHEKKQADQRSDEAPTDERVR